VGWGCPRVRYVLVDFEHETAGFIREHCNVKVSSNDENATHENALIQCECHVSAHHDNLLVSLITESAWQNCDRKTHACRRGCDSTLFVTFELWKPHVMPLLVKSVRGTIRKVSRSRWLWQDQWGQRQRVLVV